MTTSVSRMQLDKSGVVQFWAAAGAAVALNRVLVLPTFLCYCDELWWWSLEVSSSWKCRWPGAHNQTLPFRCPVDTIVNLLQVDDEPNKHGVVLKYRESSFLDNPRTPDAIRVFDPLCNSNSHNSQMQGPLSVLVMCVVSIGHSNGRLSTDSGRKSRMCTVVSGYMHVVLFIISHSMQAHTSFKSVCS